MSEQPQASQQPTDAARDRRRRNGRSGHGGDVVYFFGWIGALVYYVGHADGFWPVVLGILKSFVWPAFLVYDLLKFVSTF